MISNQDKLLAVGEKRDKGGRFSGLGGFIDEDSGKGIRFEKFGGASYTSTANHLGGFDFSFQQTVSCVDGLFDLSLESMFRIVFEFRF